MPKCGAKTRSGEPCKNIAMKNGRCRMHGGKSTGAKNNKNAAKPGGLYSKFLSEEEQAIANKMKIGSLDDEIRLTRIRLMRALQLENNIDPDDQDSELQIESKSVEPAMLPGGIVDDDPDAEGVIKRTYKRRDYSGLVDRLTARIANLEMQRASLLNITADIERKRMDNDETAKDIKQRGDGASDAKHNVMPVPACDSVDEWEAVAQKQQSEALGG